MTTKSIRDALTECAEFIRRQWDTDTADAIDIWRDRNFPESPMPSYHRWAQVNSMIDRHWTNRRCERCGLV
jgi:hypothetical protein